MQFSIDKLNSAQKKAVKHMGTPLLITAGPGTGKTLTLTYRIAYLIDEHNIPSDNILALTFTRRAANEMLERLGKISLKKNFNSKMFIGTLHAFGWKLLQNEYELQNKPIPTIYLEDDCLMILKDILKNDKFKDINPHDLHAEISLYKNNAFRINNFPIEYSEIYSNYQMRLKASNALDLDDLILDAISLLENDINIRSKYQAQYSHILIDEYQDINFAQYKLIKLLSGSGNNLTVIGDMDQAIYAFRGANISNFLNFKKDFPDFTEILLDLNYRSNGIIIQAATAVIEKNINRMDKKICTVLDRGMNIEIMNLATDRIEAEMIAKRIEQMIGGTSFFAHDSGWAKNSQSENRSFSDFAILFRLNAQGNIFEEILGKHNIPYQRVILKTDEQDNYEKYAEKVTLLTLHGAKGLEFPVIFIAGCEQGIIPYLKYDDSDIEEERRLFYVGMTRAKNKLILTSARERFLFGKKETMQTSQFISDISEELKHLYQEKNKIKKIKTKDRQMDLF
ncbi:UvrD-helicase domain-containing protein [Candidatus Poribacteria bacterium]|nr:UvrD-helicase domain-containing protein [Candidatus Poribacteria bacterium]